MALSFARRRPMKPSPGSRKPTTRLAVERLEDRWVPSGYQQTNLVGYLPGMAHRTDPLLNGWGMDYAPGGPFCVANTATDTATFYTRAGQILPLVISVPGLPTGVAYNPTSATPASPSARTVTGGPSSMRPTAVPVPT
jgi:hypothetical protein